MSFSRLPPKTGVTLDELNTALGKRNIVNVDETGFTSRVLALTNSDLDGGILEVDLSGDATGLDYTIKLPDSSTGNNEQFLTILYAAGTVNLVVTTVGGTQNVGGATTQTFNKDNESITVISDFTSTKYQVIQDSRINTGSVDVLAWNDGVTSVLTTEDWNTYFDSPSLLSGGALTKGSGVVDVAQSEFVLRSSNSPAATLKPALVTGATGLSVPDNTTRYTVVDYNSGSPITSIEADATAIPCTDKCILHIVSRVNSNIDYVTLGNYGNNFAANYVRAEAVTGWLKYGEGLAISEEGTRNIAVTAGALYVGVQRFDTPALDTSVAGTFTYYYQDGVGGWTEQTGSTQINHTQYDDGSGTLQTGNAQKYYVHAIYIRINNPSEFAVIYPQAEYNSLAEAQAAAGRPAVVPAFGDSISTGQFIGSIITKYNTVAFEDILSPFTEVLGSTTPVNHDDLAGLKAAASGVTYGHINDTAQTIAGAKTFSTGVVINEDGDDVDTRIEGDTDANLLYVDAGNDRVGIGTATPSFKLGVYNDTNGIAGADIENANTGSGAYSYLRMINDTGNSAGLLRCSSANTSYGGANSLNIYTGDTHNVCIVTNNIKRWVFGSDGITYADSVYGNTTASAASVHINASSQLLRVTSSQVWKTNIEDLWDSWVDAFMENARPIWYDSLSKHDPSGWHYLGFIAEEMAEAGLHQLVHYRRDEEGNLIPEGVQYERVTVVLTRVAQRQRDEINLLKAQMVEVIREIKEINGALGFETTGLGE